MNELMTFEGNEIEVFEFDGKVLFNAKDVAEILEIKNINDNISKMNEKQVVKLTNSIIGKTDFRNIHNTGENFLTESGVYKLIMRSNKPETERFQDWVTDEVLPSIRKNGSYAVANINNELLNLMDSKIKELDSKVKKLDDYYRPTHKEKVSISNYIKKRLGIQSKDREYELIIDRIMICFGVEKFQDIPYEKLQANMDIVDESIDVIHKENKNQLKMF